MLRRPPALSNIGYVIRVGLSLTILRATFMTDMRISIPTSVRAWLKLLVLPAVLLSSVASLPARGQEIDVDHPGGDYTRVILNAGICETLCNSDARCKAWSYVKANAGSGPEPVCWMKGAVSAPVRRPGVISGVKGAPPTRR